MFATCGNNLATGKHVEMLQFDARDSEGGIRINI